jgi:hypothetical protein
VFAMPQIATKSARSSETSRSAKSSHRVLNLVIPSPVDSSSPSQPTCSHIQCRYTGVTGSSRKCIIRPPRWFTGSDPTADILNGGPSIKTPRRRCPAPSAGIGGALSKIRRRPPTLLARAEDPNRRGGLHRRFHVARLCSESGQIVGASVKSA